MQKDLAFCRSGTPLTEPVRIFACLAHLECQYPGFDRWFWKKVVPGLLDGSRRVFMEDDGHIRGIVISKRSPSQRKLCTVWVDSDCTGQGIGRALMEDAMKWLGTARPLITVPEERLFEFEPLFKRWRFSLDQVVHSLYRADCREYVFNGLIVDSSQASKIEREKSERSSALIS
jgi:GNAT superfamily N-acetyltransferase